MATNMNISLQGYNSKYVTFEAEGEMKSGNLVAVSANNCVKKATAGKFAGIVHSLRSGYALVQTSGFAQVGYSGSAPALGFVKLASDANSVAVIGETGREVLITSVDTTDKIVGFIF